MHTLQNQVKSKVRIKALRQKLNCHFKKIQHQNCNHHSQCKTTGKFKSANLPGPSSAYGRFPDRTFPVQDDSRTRRFPPDISRTRWTFRVHLKRQSSFWKSVFIVTSAYNILSLIQLCKHSFLAVILNTLSQVTAAWFWLCSMVTSVHLVSVFF